MPRLLARWAVVVGSVVLTVIGTSLARASVNDLEAARLLPSAIPALLGPITEGGRAGWECAPERAAQSTSPAKAELPEDTGW
jgi:hypothetical protein